MFEATFRATHLYLWVLDLLWWSSVSPFPTEALRSFWTWRKWQVFDIEDLGRRRKSVPLPLRSCLFYWRKAGGGWQPQLWALTSGPVLGLLFLNCRLVFYYEQLVCKEKMRNWIVPWGEWKLNIIPQAFSSSTLTLLCGMVLINFEGPGLNST